MISGLLANPGCLEQFYPLRVRLECASAVSLHFLATSAPPNDPSRHPKCHATETVNLLIQVRWGCGNVPKPGIIRNISRSAPAETIKQPYIEVHSRVLE